MYATLGTDAVIDAVNETSSTTLVCNRMSAPTPKQRISNPGTYSGSGYSVAPYGCCLP